MRSRASQPVGVRRVCFVCELRVVWRLALTLVRPRRLWPSPISSGESSIKKCLILIPTSLRRTADYSRSSRGSSRLTPTSKALESVCLVWLTRRQARRSSFRISNGATGPSLQICTRLRDYQSRQITPRTLRHWLSYGWAARRFVTCATLFSFLLKREYVRESFLMARCIRVSPAQRASLV